jgi:hypothetical protein
MGEAVTIISVSTTALLGMGSLAVAAFGGSRERRWQTQEERATELRAVLEHAGESLSSLLLTVGDAHDEMSRVPLSKDRQENLRDREKAIVVHTNKIGVRRGSRSPEYTSCRDYWLAISELTTILDEAGDEGLDKEQQSAFSKGWKKALAAEAAYLDAAAKALSGADPVRRGRVRRVPLPHPLRPRVWTLQLADRGGDDEARPGS